MELMWIVYLVKLADTVVGFAIGTAYALGLLLLLWRIFYMWAWSDMNSYDEDSVNALKTVFGLGLWKSLFYVWLISVFAIVTIPNKQTSYMMLGAYAAQKVSTSPQAQMVVDKVVAIVNLELDKQISTLKQEKK